MGSLRSSAQAHDLGYLANESLAANRNQSSRRGTAGRALPPPSPLALDPDPFLGHRRWPPRSSQGTRRRAASPPARRRRRLVRSADRPGYRPPSPDHPPLPADHQALPAHLGGDLPCPQHGALLPGPPASPP